MHTFLSIAVNERELVISWWLFYYQPHQYENMPFWPFLCAMYLSLTRANCIRYIQIICCFPLHIMLPFPCALDCRRHEGFEHTSRPDALRMASPHVPPSQPRRSPLCSRPLYCSTGSPRSRSCPYRGRPFGGARAPAKGPCGTERADHQAA